jgi:hypothetical protein
MIMTKPLETITRKGTFGCVEYNESHSYPVKAYFDGTKVELFRYSLEGVRKLHASLGELFAELDREPDGNVHSGVLTTRKYEDPTIDDLMRSAEDYKNGVTTDGETADDFKIILAEYDGRRMGLRFLRLWQRVKAVFV